MIIEFRIHKMGRHLQTKIAPKETQTSMRGSFINLRIY